MKVTLMNIPNPEICAIAAGMCYDAKDPWRALSHALAGGHESVIEHANFTFLIEGVSRVLLAQLTRHRHASFSVRSQRYCGAADGHITPESVKEAVDRHPLREQFIETVHAVEALYDALLAADVPAEDARYFTFQGGVTRLVMTANARELRHFFSLRCCNRAQWEIRQMADEMLRQCKEAAPALFEDAGAGCVRGKCPEGAKSCGKPRRQANE